MKLKELLEITHEEQLVCVQTENGVSALADPGVILQDYKHLLNMDILEVHVGKMRIGVESSTSLRTAGPIERFVLEVCV